MFGLGVFRILPFLSIGHYSIPFFRDANANEENVALLKGNIALLGNLQDIRQADLMSRECSVVNSLLFRPCSIINQYAAP